MSDVDEFLQHEKEYKDLLEKSMKVLEDNEKKYKKLVEDHDNKVRKIVIDSGKLLEQLELVNRDKICLELKRSFNGYISRSDIDRFCPPQWKYNQIGSKEK